MNFIDFIPFFRRKACEKEDESLDDARRALREKREQSEAAFDCLTRALDRAATVLRSETRGENRGHGECGTTRSLD